MILILSLLTQPRKWFLPILRPVMNEKGMQAKTIVKIRHIATWHFPAHFLFSSISRDENNRKVTNQIQNLPLSWLIKNETFRWFSTIENFVTLSFYKHILRHYVTDCNNSNSQTSHYF